MDTSGVNPNIAELGVRVAEATIRNTAGAINTRIRAVTARKNDQETIAELQEIVSSLISDKNDLLQIAQAYEQELVAQRISEDDIAYITDSVVPVLKGLATQTGDSEAGAKIDAVAPLLSVETLTVLQLLGFNFKKAIGEPLTLLLQKLITSRLPLDPHDTLENAGLNAAVNIELLKVAQDEEATKRWEKLLAGWNSKQG